MGSPEDWGVPTLVGDMDPDDCLPNPWVMQAQLLEGNTEFRTVHV